LRFNFFGTGKIFDTAGGMRRRLFFNVVAAAVIFYSAFFVVHIAVSAFTGTQIPNEYREAANVDLTLSIIQGVNPYSLAALDGPRPGLVFQYGPLFSLLVAGVHFIVPFIDIIALHYVVAFICVMTAAVMASVMAKENTETLLPCAVVFLFTIVCTWRYGYINAVPDTLGVTLLVLILFVET